MNQQDQEFSGTSLDARGDTGPFGKYDHEIKVYLDGHTRVLLEQRAHRMGISCSELGRDLVFRYVHGRLPSEISAERRRLQMDREGLDEGLIQAAGVRP